MNNLVEQEVKCRLFEEKLERERLRKQERERDKQDREREIQRLKSKHEREMNQLKAKLELRLIVGEERGWFKISMNVRLLKFNLE